MLLGAEIQAIASEKGFLDLQMTADTSAKTWNVPGYAVALITDGGLTSKTCGGTCQIGTAEAVNDETLFSIGSLTKAFTATALAILVDEGKLNWNDPVTKHLPSFYLFSPEITQQVTICDLLSHRTGLEAHEGDLLWVGHPYSRKEIVRRIRYFTPTYSFRTTYAYQNILLVAAGEVVEAVSGLTWDEFIAKRIFIPLGMQKSFSFLKTKPHENGASAHACIDQSIQPIAWDSIESFGPAGSIVSNLSDMVKWLRFQLLASSGADTQLAKASSLKELYSPQINVSLAPPLKTLYPDNDSIAYGLGWFLYDYRGRKAIQHDGFVNGMSSFLLMLPDDGFGVVALTNLKDSLFPVSISYQLRDAWIEQSQHKWDEELQAVCLKIADEEAEAEKAIFRERISNTAPSHNLSEYVGTYQDSLYGDVVIWSDEADTLHARVIAVNGILEHWHYNTFRFIPEDKTLSKPLIAFHFNDAGKIESLTLPGLLPKNIFVFNSNLHKE